jgi:anaerobic selenocysteine-containing dehydrogenase
MREESAESGFIPSSLLYQREGPLTRELVRAPGGFGLGQVPARARPDATTKMVCGYCSTGCGLTIHLQGRGPRAESHGTGNDSIADSVATSPSALHAVSLTPTTDYPVNLGMACPKGWEALTVLDAPDRATTPLLRNEHGKLVPVDWNRAMREFVTRFKTIQQEHGKESVAFLSTGQMVTEEMAFLGALAKFGMGLRHGDGNTRQCMATAVVAYKQAFGFDAPPYTYADFEESDCIVLVGSNLCLAHPIMWERVMRNPHRPEIVVVDPRMTETAMNATQHLALNPKSDQTLLYGIARILIERGWIDKEFIRESTAGFEEFARFVEPFTIERVTEETGLTADQIHRFASTIHERKRVSFWWTMGVNQSHQGVRTAQAIINLALMTGNIGRPGTGANSITGQCNAMGSRLFSNTTNLLGGHDFANAEHRRKVAGILDIDADRIPTEPSWAYNEIMEGILRGKIKGLWVICTNTAHSWINQNEAREILERLDFLVVQDMYHSTETARMADLVLPAAGWGEKEGTFINSERRIGVVKKVRQAPGESLSDFNIFRLIAHHWNRGEMFSRWDSPASVFELLKECTRGMPCDITGIEGYRMIEESGGIQWPFGERGGVSPPIERIIDSQRGADAAPLAGRERRLFEDGRFYHPDGRARFLFEEPRPLTERPSERYPLLLLTGRGSASQWHTQTRTSKSAVLKKLYPEKPFVEINPQDAKRLGIRQNEWVGVESQRGRMQAMAFLTHAVPPGQVFIPMHYEPTNRLTDAVFDPYSKQPAYKACAVRIVTTPS